MARDAATLTLPRRTSPLRALIALAVGITFLLLVSAAASHVHYTDVDADDCGICSVVIGGLHNAPAVQVDVPPRLPAHPLRLPGDTGRIYPAQGDPRPPSRAPPRFM